MKGKQQGSWVCLRMRYFMSRPWPWDHDLGLGIVTKVKVWKGAGRKCNLKVTFALAGV